MYDKLEKCDVGFVILTWNSDRYIEKCLESIVQMTSIKSSVYVIDNGSSDNTVDIVKKFENEKFSNAKIDMVKLPCNYGTTKSRNIGIRKLQDMCRYICVLDSDTVINENAIITLINTLEADDRNGIAGPCMKDENGKIQNSGRKIPTATVKLLKVLPVEKLKKKAEAMEQYPDSSKDYRYTGYLMSACWLIKTEVFENIGLLDENIFYAPEDVEFCLRAWTKGYKVLYCSKVQIIHSWQRLSRKKLFSKHNYEHIKGLAYMFYKYKFLFSNKKFEKYFK